MVTLCESDGWIFKEDIVFNIVWRRADGAIIFIGLTNYKTEGDASDALRTLYCHRNSDCFPNIEPSTNRKGSEPCDSCDSSSPVAGHFSFSTSSVQMLTFCRSSRCRSIGLSGLSFL